MALTIDEFGARKRAGNYLDKPITTLLLYGHSRNQGAFAVTKQKGHLSYKNRGIVCDEQGVAWIADTTTKVVEVVREFKRHKTPEQIVKLHPNWTLRQVMAALDYYTNHTAEIEADMERRDMYVEEVRRNTISPFSREQLEERLRERGGETRT